MSSTKKDDPTKRTDADVVTERTEADKAAPGTGYGGPAAVPGGLTNPDGDLAAAAAAAQVEDPEAMRAQIAALEARVKAAEAEAKKSARSKRGGPKYVARHSLALNDASKGTDRDPTAGRRDIAAGEAFDATDAELAGLRPGVDYDE
jgi:hypothetical protein